MNHRWVPLSDLGPGHRCIVRTVKRSPIEGRVLDMGVLPDTHLEIVRQAPLSGPMALRLRGYCLSVRQSDAGSILVEEVD